MGEFRNGTQFWVVKEVGVVLAGFGKGGSNHRRAIGPIGKLRAFAESVGRKFIKGHALGNRLCPAKV